MPSAFPTDVMQAPRVRLPGRDYLLFTGALDEPAGVWGPESGWPERQSPNLFWPADKAWFVATEIDFDSTLVGGSDRLVRQLLASATLDAWPVEPTDSLAHDADRVTSNALGH